MAGTSPGMTKTLLRRREPTERTQVERSSMLRREGPQSPEREWAGHHAAGLSDRSRESALVSSARRLFKGDEETFDPARPDAALDFDGGDRLELPALSSMLVEHLLELGAGHLAAGQGP